MLSPSDCIFCRIVAGSAPASVVYRDDDVFAFMDIRPFNVGHVLVVPVHHAAYLADLDLDVGGKLFRIAQQIADATRRSGIRCEGINLFLADGAIAGQEVFHTHLHVIPRFDGDEFDLLDALASFVKVSRDQLDDTAANIRSAIGSGHSHPL